MLGFVPRHDLRTLRILHPATLTAAGIVLFSYVIIELLAIQPWAIATAASLAGT